MKKPKGWILRSSMWLPAELDAVFAFFADARNLEALTPPWLKFAIETPEPIEMAVGTKIDYRLRVRGLPMRWRTNIAEWDPPRAFADDQIRGPYKRWYHRHTFAAVDGGTQIGDRIELVPPGGPFAPLLFRLFVRGGVLRIFRYRSKALAERFGGDANAAKIEIVSAGTEVEDDREVRPVHERAGR